MLSPFASELAGTKPGLGLLRPWIKSNHTYRREVSISDTKSFISFYIIVIGEVLIYSNALMNVIMLSWRRFDALELENLALKALDI